MSEKANRPAAVWVIINLIYTVPVFLLFIFGAVFGAVYRAVYRNVIFPDDIYKMIRGITELSHPLLIFRLLYQGFYIELIFTFITFLILYSQLYNFKKEHKPLSVPLVVGEAFIIVVNVLDHTPLLGTEQLYYTIPGW